MFMISVLSVSLFTERFVLSPSSTIRKYETLAKTGVKYKPNLFNLFKFKKNIMVSEMYLNRRT